MVSFELGEELKFFVLSRAWDKEKILSPHEESNLRPSDLRSDALPLSHRDSSVSEIYYEVHMIRVLDDVPYELRKSEGLRFDSSWELRIFFFVPRS